MEVTAPNTGLVSARGEAAPHLGCVWGGAIVSEGQPAQAQFGDLPGRSSEVRAKCLAHANQQTRQGEGAADQGFGDLHFASLCGSRPRSCCWRRRLNPAHGPGPFIPLALSAQSRYHPPLQMASSLSWLLWSSCRAASPTHTNSSSHPRIPSEGVKCHPPSNPSLPPPLAGQDALPSPQGKGRVPRDGYRAGCQRRAQHLEGSLPRAHGGVCGGGEWGLHGEQWG